MPMKNQWNFFLRQILVILALSAMLYWLWQFGFSYPVKIVYAAAILILTFLIWIVIGNRKDPYKSAKPILKVSGGLKLSAELAFFAFSIYCLFQLGLTRWSWIFSNVLLLHYAFSHQRIASLLK